MLKIIVGIILFIVLLTVYSACVVSGRCSREEEERDKLQ